MACPYGGPPACAGMTMPPIFISSGGPKAHGNSFENRPMRVIPAKLVPAKAGSGKPASSGLTWPPRLRRGDHSGDFHFLGWAAGSWILRQETLHAGQAAKAAIHLVVD